MIKCQVWMHEPWFLRRVPSGKHTRNYGKSPCSMGNLTISTAIFNSNLLVITRGYFNSIPNSTAVWGSWIQAWHCGSFIQKISPKYDPSMPYPGVNIQQDVEHPWVVDWLSQGKHGVSSSTSKHWPVGQKGPKKTEPHVRQVCDRPPMAAQKPQQTAGATLHSNQKVGKNLAASWVGSVFLKGITLQGEIWANLGESKFLSRHIIY